MPSFKEVQEQVSKYLKDKKRVGNLAGLQNLANKKASQNSLNELQETPPLNPSTEIETSTASPTDIGNLDVEQELRKPFNQGGVVPGYAFGGMPGYEDDPLAAIQSRQPKFNPQIGLPPPPPLPSPVQASPPQAAPVTMEQNPYGADQQMAVAQDIQKRQGSLGRVIPQAMGGMADALMQGVARAGSSNFQSNITNQQNTKDAAIQAAMEKAYGTKKDENAATLKMQGMNAPSPMSAQAQGGYTKILKDMGWKDEDIVKIPADRIDEVVKQAVLLAGDKIKAGTAKEALAAKPLAGPTLTPGQIAADKAFGKNWENYETQGGAPQFAANYKRLTESLSALKERGSSVRDKLTPGFARSLTNPKYAMIEQDIRANVIAMLRQTLGAQFTEKEGEKIFNLNFDPQLGAANIPRMQKLAESLKQAANDKERAGAEFEAKGTISQFKGSQKTFEAPGSAPATDKAARLAELRAKRDAGTIGK